MVASHFIAARVSSETKTRLKTLAEQRQLSESALLKRVLELTLDGAADPKLGNPGVARMVARAARLYLRLRPDDQLLLMERATARGMAAATYVSVLVRAHLRHLTPLPKVELMAFRRSRSPTRCSVVAPHPVRSLRTWWRCSGSAPGCGTISRRRYWRTCAAGRPVTICRSREDQTSWAETARTPTRN
jgi:predicted DNA-binding protein